MTRLYLKCCDASSKDECSWPPCPANVDCYSGSELVALAAEDEHRVDDAIAIFTGTPDES
jgi:hypothetical protein